MGTPGFPRAGAPTEELAAPTDPLSNDPTTETADPA